MGTTTTTSAVYIHVIEDVVNKVREEFINNGGPGESVLSELQGIWETKMMQAGVLNGPIERSSAQKPTPGGPLTHDLNVPYEGTEEYETPTAEMLFPPTPLQTPLPTPLPGTADNSSMYNIPTGSSDYPTPGTENGVNIDVKARPSPYMPPPSPWTNPRLDVNVAYVDGRDEPEKETLTSSLRRIYLCHPLGNENVMILLDIIKMVDLYLNRMVQAMLSLRPNFECDAFRITSIGDRKVPRDFFSSSSKIPQVDGPMPDPYDEMLSTPNIYSYQGPSEEFNEARTPAPNEYQTSTPVAVQNDIIEDDEELLNEDDDDDELDDLESGEDMNTQHLVLAQFDKVTRTKSRWKCSLKDGIMHINDKDILFNKAAGEFDF
uniref:TFIIA n=1 Tax=Arabidopsis thaliana TaxID=3702 RepID=Q39235_ARATH|nr:TFIIA [Arabidopsis thaliana]